MISRRQIVSRSSHNLAEPTYQLPEEDVWYHKDKLYKDHLEEVLKKWTQIDDDIWAKVIVFEKNRRVAKAYARAPVLTVNGASEEFDGFRIGLCSFENPIHDQRTEELKRHIGHGVKIKMDEAGNILIKRISKSNVYIKHIDQNNAQGNEILKLPNCALQLGNPVKLFDIKKFQANIKRELRQAYPDRRKLEYQCLSAVAFVKSESDLLNCPIWVLIINVVAMDMLKSKLSPIMDVKNRPSIPIPHEEAYLSQKRSEQPPKLPPRTNLFHHNIPKPDYGTSSKLLSSQNKEKPKDSRKYEDPYYCGLRARVSNFVANSKAKEPSSKRFSINQKEPSFPMVHYPGTSQHRQPSIRHAKSYESGIDLETVESPYSQIYGRLPVPTRAFIPSQSRNMYVGKWQ